MGEKVCDTCAKLNDKEQPLAECLFVLPSGNPEWRDMLRQIIGTKQQRKLSLLMFPAKGLGDCCKEVLRQKLIASGARSIILLGNEALSAVTNKRGISRERGQVQTVEGITAWILPTLSPGAIAREPGLYSTLAADIQRGLDLSDQEFTASSTSKKIIHHVLSTVEDVAGCFSYLVARPFVTCDIETGGGNESSAYNGGYIIAIGFGYTPTRAAIIPRSLLSNMRVKDMLRSLFCRLPSVVMHNGKFDVQYLRVYLGVDSSVVRCHHDTMLQHYVLRNEIGENRLKGCASMYLGAPDYEKGLKQYTGKEGDYARIPDDVLHTYLGHDVCYTHQLHELFYPEVCAAGKQDLYEGLIIPVADVLSQVEANGIGVDIPYATQKNAEYVAKLVPLRQRLDREARTLGWDKPVELTLKGQPRKKKEGYYDFNANSPTQVAEILYDKLKLTSPDRRKPRGTDADILEFFHRKMNHPFLENLMEYRTLSKIQGTYLAGVPAKCDPTGRVHGRYNVHGTQTGRLSAAEPNLQNIPRAKRSEGKDVKNMFVAPEGYVFLQADFSQAELRVLAQQSGEPFLHGVYQRGEDLHSAMAAKIFGPDFTDEQRTVAKTTNFGAAYGATAQTIAEQAKVPLDFASATLAAFWQQIPVAQKWLEEQKDEAIRTGRLTTVFGRTRTWDKLRLGEDTDAVRREAGNFKIQSVASDLMLYSLIHIAEWLRINPVARLVNTVHDSVLLEVKIGYEAPVARIVHEIMTTLPQQLLSTTLPFDCDFEKGPRWGELTKYNDWKSA